ncbi:hypothetical protein LVJ82_08605 [Vitreoscilla massiliensis]|uniref:Peptidase inhibitor I78 family protein n=1 Tax=Vitreoscilla massiliensis TaxID=1689272 RepID=A0ABY4E946_9NEIS|nr:I78 family peptidase inhibitor [Vitreoscilla massiliensis]UOO91008.1 hypothetical protein LVJ82_08605 [Vitreoscilla massiliensis]
MLKYASLLAVIALTAACAHTPKHTPADDAANAPGKCINEQAQALSGLQGLNDAEIMQRTGATEVRHLAPNGMATMDYRFMRITVVTDPVSKKILHANCG